MHSRCILRDAAHNCDDHGPSMIHGCLQSDQFDTVLDICWRLSSDRQPHDAMCYTCVPGLRTTVYLFIILQRYITTRHLSFNFWDSRIGMAAAAILLFSTLHSFSSGGRLIQSPRCSILPGVTRFYFMRCDLVLPSYRRVALLHSHSMLQN